MSEFDLIMLDQHEAELRELIFEKPGTEGAAYVLMRTSKIEVDPWDRRARTKLLVKEIVAIEPEHKISSSDVHVTWDTKGFVELLQRSDREGLVLGIVHCHPRGPKAFSQQDDENEAELLRSACNRNGRDTEFVSILFDHEGGIQARVWLYPNHSAMCQMVGVLGDRFRYHFPQEHAAPSSVFNRQVLAFGPTLTSVAKELRIGIVGAGGTGSAAAMLAARMGFGQILVLDDDIVDVTNLNRLHGARQSDADGMVPKVDVLVREISSMGLGIKIVGRRGWVNDTTNQDALKACDIVLCCTDDNSGRIFLNRLAYFYCIPVIDMGLAMSVSSAPGAGMADISARVTVVLPPGTCLLCRDAVDPELAREEELRRSNPHDYDRQKREAYVRGEGNPNPAVVTFTTEVACMALNELLNRIAGYRKKAMGNELRRRFLFCEDRSTGAAPRHTCQICGHDSYWAVGDVDPFLDMVSG
ncbi:MAG: ThiF family adenylyltransferase [Afipia sp.]|nr:ThiF family adenylyltransferase [Afipia sp.]